MTTDGKGLILSLKPKERFLVGGALLENGPKRGTVRVMSEDVFVLRLSDAIHPDDVESPVTRAYHAAQLILACEVPHEEGRRDLLARLDELAPIFARTEGARAIAAACEAAQGKRYYSALRSLRALIPIEEAMLGRGIAMREHQVAYRALIIAPRYR